MAHLTIRVPETHIEPLRRELLRARETAGESEVADLDEAIDQLDANGDVELTAHPEVLSDAVHAVLFTALRELSAAVERYWRGADAGTEVAERTETVASLVALFRGVQD